jgi:hypothetical protein
LVIGDLQLVIGDWRLVIDPLRRADCRLKNWYCNILRHQPATAIPAILGQAMIVENLPRTRRR